MARAVQEVEHWISARQYASEFGQAVMNLVPGKQMADQAQTAFANGNYGWAAAFAIGSIADASLGVLTGGESKFVESSVAKAGSEILPGMSGPTVQGMMANKHCIDCSDIASYFFNASGGKGVVLEVNSTGRNSPNAYENGQITVEHSYHQVYPDGRYVYDPRVSSTPRPQGD
jgi:hypothetical protein